MSLKQLLLILSTATAVMLLLTGSLLYSFAADETENLNRKAFLGTAQGIASTIHGYVQQMTHTVDRIANDPDFVRLGDLGNLGHLQALANERARFLPGLLRLRILPKDIDEPDKSQKPHMSFADLLMVKDALNSTPPPAIHGHGTPHKHLAIARKIVVDDRIAGIVLASYSVDQFRKTISAANLNEGAIELKQGDLGMGFSGEQALKDAEPTGSVNIGRTDWKINYWIPTDNRSDWVLFFAIILTATLLLTLLHLYGFRWLKRSLKNDQSSIVNVAEELILRKAQGTHPIIIKDLRDTLPMLIRLKRKMRADSAVSDESNEERIELVSDSDTEELPREIVPPKDIFRAYDIRGVVGESLTDDTVKAIGRALGSEADECGEQTVIIAHDGRLSSPHLRTALAQGLQNSGRNVIDIGMVPTPVLYFATHFLESNTGIMITGSHNPPEYNGLKMVVNGETLSEERIQRLRQRIENNDLVTGSGSLETKDINPDYVGTIADDIQIGQPIKVVVDCGNGVAGNIAPVLMRSIGCEVVELYCDVDGNFPNHHPDPSKPENLKALIQSVESEGADLGLAFDGDGDRLGVVDSEGNIIWPDRQMMLFSADVLSRQPGADIIFDVKCSKHLATEIVNHGGRPIMWKTGHSLIKAKIKETGAQLAGEMSGHIFFTERWYGFDDALYSAARLLEILSADSRSSSEIFAELPDSVNTPELNIRLAEGENFLFIEKLLSQASFTDAKITTIDGLRVDFTDGWGLVRASNTTPSLVLRFEADDEQALKKIQEQFKSLMLKVDSQLSLPF